MKLFRKGLFSNTLNIIGLSIALTAFMIIMVQVKYDLDFNKNYQDYQDIYRVEYANDNINIEEDDVNKLSYNEYSAYLSIPIIDQIVVSSATIESYFTIYNLEKNRQVRKKKDEATVSSKYLSTDIGFIEMIQPKMHYGNSNHLAKEGIIISQRLSNKLFGKENPCGEILANKKGDWNKSIAGVYKDFPQNSSFKGCDIIEINQNIDHNNTNEWSYNLYLKLKPKADPALTEENITRNILQSSGDIDSTKVSAYIKARFLRLSTIADTHFSHDVKYDTIPKANKHTTYSLITIAILIVLIAIINFINFSLASVPSQIKAINTRKILGCSLTKLRSGIILKAMLLAFISFILSILLVFLLSGSFLTEFLSVDLSITRNYPILMFTGMISILTGFFAGIYPAYYSTSFKPAVVLNRGSFSLSSKGKQLRYFLIGFQYIISITLIIVAIIISRQTDFMQKYDLGYQKEHILITYISNNLAKKADVVRDKLCESTTIKDVCFSRSVIISNNKMGWQRDYKGKQIDFDCLPVSTNFIDFFGLQVVKGRDFRKSDETALGGTFIFNTTAVNRYNLKIGDRITGHLSETNGRNALIAGIVKDFNFEPLYYGINPIALYIMGPRPWSYPRYTYLKLNPKANVKSTIRYIKKSLKELDPTITDNELTISSMDEHIGLLYSKERSLSSLIMIFSILSVIISIIGIMGLIYFEINFRKKEISLRKVFGASMGSILRMLNNTYLKIAFICWIISIPIAVLIAKSWFKNFQYHTNLAWWIFALALLVIGIVTSLVITLESLQAAYANPVKSITNE